MIKKIILSTIVLSSIGIGVSAYAMYGQGMGAQLTDEQRSELQSMSMEERQAYMQNLRVHSNMSNNHMGNPTEMIANIPSSDLSENKKTEIINQYGEEKLARDIYNYAYEKYNLPIFANIARSEQQHMNAIQVLLDRYNIPTPTDYAADNELFITLKNKVYISEKDAIEAGIQIEILDIENIDKTISSTDNDDLKIIFTKIGGASYNHMKGFVNILKVKNYTTDLEWNKYITEEDLNIRGPLNQKLIDRLKTEGIKLPEMPTCNNQNGTHFKGQNNHKNNRNNNKNKYKSILSKRYKSKIDSFSENQTKLILNKIDEVMNKFKNNENISEEKKEISLSILDAFKELLQEKLY